MYHTKVYVNRKYAGENFYSFTPTLLDIKRFLRPNQENEIIVGVGCKNNLPDTVTNGADYEKLKYIPGIYDKVEIFQAGYPFINQVQIAPNVVDTSIRVQVKLNGGGNHKDGTINYIVRELFSGKEVKQNSVAFSNQLADFNISLKGGQLWSPENPFLYTLEINTSADKKTTRFGIRSFEFLKGKQYALLNKQPYFLRGTNVTLMRFFEDTLRSNLPWKDDWVIQLHKRFKDFYWNSMRYCIGFPPERWYEVADSLGIMIQDEYPIWGLGKNVKAEHLAREYKDWMQERWNHPSVVIWDAQNETLTTETGKAIQLVRSLDLSNRPWDNGYSEPQSETDPIESHPYLFIWYYFNNETPSSAGAAVDMLSGRRLPMNDPNEHSPSPDGRYFYNPVIINEYSWLWLNRDGSTTTVTDKVYPAMFGDTLTRQQRFEYGARYTAMLTEYWRAYRTSAAVMHFCSLGYSREKKPRGQTSDNFIDVTTLQYEPYFVKYVKPSFAPVGLMIDAWYKTYGSNQIITVPVHMINNTYQTFTDSLRLEVQKDGKALLSKAIKVNVNSKDKAIYQFQIQLPADKGKYELIAYYDSKKGEVFCARPFEIK